jgi:hypothetical protein
MSAESPSTKTLLAPGGSGRGFGDVGTGAGEVRCGRGEVRVAVGLGAGERVDLGVALGVSLGVGLDVGDAVGDALGDADVGAGVGAATGGPDPHATTARTAPTARARRVLMVRASSPGGSSP